MFLWLLISQLMVCKNVRAFVRWKSNFKLHSTLALQELKLSGSKMEDINWEHFQRGFKKSASSSIVALSLIFNLGIAAPSRADEYPVFNEVWTMVHDNFFDPTYNNNDIDQIKQNYLTKLNNGANEKELTKKFLSSLGDKYTKLLDKKLFESLWKYDAIGVGLLFQTDLGKDMIVASPPVSGSSGETAGIKKGDVVYSINGKSTDKMTAANLLEMMSNDNADYVSIELGRKSDADGQIERKRVELKRSKQSASNPVCYYAKILSNGEKVGYVSLSEFNALAVPELKKAVLDLDSQGIDRLLLDLRGNLGGGFQFALNIGGMFMNDKEMVSAKGKDPVSNVFKTSFPDGVIFQKPLLLLTDGLSASASEVLAAGLHDNCRAAITGAKTFGKGKIQAVFGLSDGEGITMTVAQYITPNGVSIQSKGIEPDFNTPTINPYVKVILGNVIKSKVDLEKIDFSQADKYTNDICKPPSSLSGEKIAASNI